MESIFGKTGAVNETICRRLGFNNVFVFTNFGLDLTQMLAAIGFDIETYEDEFSNYAGDTI
jgi:hypothetical protein